MAEETKSYTELFANISSEYHNGFSDDLSQNQRLGEIFWNPNDTDTRIKLAADSDLHRFDRDGKIYLVLTANFWDWESGLNLLRDKNGNGDHFVVQAGKDGLQTLGRLHLYVHCRESWANVQLGFECERKENMYSTMESLDWQNGQFVVTKSQRKFVGGKR